MSDGMREKSKNYDLKEEIILTPLEEEKLHIVFNEKCEEIFNLLCDNEIRGYTLSYGFPYDLSNNKIRRSSFQNRTSSFLIAKKKNDGTIKRARRLSVLEEMKFINSYEKENIKKRLIKKMSE